MRQKNRCLCVSHSKWEDKATLQKYITQCAVKLRESTQHTGVLDRGSGLTTLLDLKSTSWARQPISVTRALIQEEIPFRPTPCAKIVNCCGLCTVKCLHRCVQDTYQRLYEVVFPLHIGAQKIEEVPADVRAAYKTMLDPRTTYEELVETVNAFIDRKDEYYANYSCEEVYYQTKNGPYRKKTDPETGEVIMYNWPSSGMCPFCVPRVLYYKLRSQAGD